MKATSPTARKPTTSVFICTSCSEDSDDFLEIVGASMDDVEIKAIDCMSGCARGQTAAVRAHGKVAYLFGELTEADVGLLEDFVSLYEKSPDGTFADARVLGQLRNKVIARIPG